VQRKKYGSGLLGAGVRSASVGLHLGNQVIYSGVPHDGVFELKQLDDVTPGQLCKLLRTIAVVSPFGTDPELQGPETRTRASCRGRPVPAPIPWASDGNPGLRGDPRVHGEVRRRRPAGQRRALLVLADRPR
jgi:hypothetical protein